MAVSKALEEGARAVICASTGNTAASAAAYAARAGIPALVLQPRGAVAGGKLAQTRALGARVLRELLARPLIYATEEFRSRFEEKARENMEHELSS